MVDFNRLSSLLINQWILLFSVRSIPWLYRRSLWQQPSHQPGSLSQGGVGRNTGPGDRIHEEERNQTTPSSCRNCSRWIRLCTDVVRETPNTQRQRSHWLTQQHFQPTLSIFKVFCEHVWKASKCGKFAG